MNSVVRIARSSATVTKRSSVSRTFVSTPKAFGAAKHDVKFEGLNAPRVSVDSKSKIDVQHVCDEATDIINYPSRRPLADMSHDEVYVLDANLVICYKNNHIPAWNKFADEHMALGKKFFMVSFNFDEVEGGCPPDWCEALNTDQPVTIAGMEPFYQRVLEKFEVKGNMRRKLKVSALSAPHYKV
jgi:hypothetical protein